jgi:apolipoprotein N-acyltransferase
MQTLPSSVSRLKGWKAAALAAAAGALSALSMAPFHFWPILFLTFPALVWLFDGAVLRDARRIWARRPWWRSAPAQGAFLGWAFGFGYFLAGLYWIGYSFLVQPELYAWAMPFAVAALPAGLALFYAAAAALAVLMWRRGFLRLLGFAIAFFLAELARGTLLTGFPWNLFGYALAASPAPMQIAAYIGVYGLTFAALLVFTAPAALIAPREAKGDRLTALPLALALAFLGLIYGGGAARLAQAGHERVAGVTLRLVQPNVPQKEKWNPDSRRWIFERLLQLSRSGADGRDISNFTYVIWPESSVPFLFAFNGAIANSAARDLLADLVPAGTTLVLGAERAEGARDETGRATFEKVYNSLFALDADAHILDVYDKTHLVPFGEYIPFKGMMAPLGLGIFANRLDGFDAGERRTIIKAGSGPPFAPLICYEVIFPGRVTPPGQRPQWLVNVTNDAWFGASTGPYQHLHFAQVRAAEEGLPIIRTANTGISAVIDAYGRIVAKLDLNQMGVIDHGLPRAIPETIFATTHASQLIILVLFPVLIYFVIVSRLRKG